MEEEQSNDEQESTQVNHTNEAVDSQGKFHSSEKHEDQWEGVSHEVKESKSSQMSPDKELIQAKRVSGTNE